MISESAQFGGSMSISGSTTLTMASPRLVRCGSAGGSFTVTLPSTTNHIIDPGEYGASRFVIVNDSGRGVTVQHPSSAEVPSTVTLIVLANQEVAFVGLTPTAWVAFKRPLNTPRAAGFTPRDPIVNPDVAATYTPDQTNCFVGDDCELAQAIALVSENGTPSVLAPMYINPCPGASGFPHEGNREREAVRGADCIMPSAVVVRLSDEFTSDPDHRLVGQLSAECLQALVNTPHILQFDEDAELEDATTRNPYHVGRDPPPATAWTFGPPFNVTKHFWKREVEYTVGEETFTLSIVFQMEHTADPQPRKTSFGGSAGGACDDEAGAWGALFCVYVFTNELEPDFEDGDSFIPTGGTDPVVFHRHDPLVWGNAPGVEGGDNDDKFCHPQLLAAAMLPTTFHSPCQFNWIPLLERDGGYNREWAYRRPNCAPWITDPERDLPNLCEDCNETGAGLRNVVFGMGTELAIWRAMSLGGNCPVSRPVEHLVWENGLGAGRTYFKPAHAGWDEEIGELTSESSGTISLCIGATWPDFDIQCCDGNEAEPFRDVGGGHGCLRTGPTPASIPGQLVPGTSCCVTIDRAIAFWYQSCVSTFFEFGDPSGGACTILETGCEMDGSYFTQHELEVYDYSLGGDVVERWIMWKRYLLDPRAETWSYTYDMGDVVDILDMIGTWTLEATVTPTSFNVLTTIRAMVGYAPTRGIWDGDWRDAVISFTALNATNASHGAGMRARTEGLDNASGIFAFIKPTGVDTGLVKIIRMVANEEIVLASVAIVLDDDTVDVVVTFSGYSFTVAWEVVGGETGSLTANDCTYQDGGVPVLATQDSDSENTAEFDNWVIVDNSTQFLELASELASDSGSLTAAPLQLLDGYGKCEGETTNGCGSWSGTPGEPAICNCRSEFQVLYSVTGAIWPEGTLLEGLPTPTDPTYLGGPMFLVYGKSCFGSWCYPATYYCGECPLPYPGANFVVPRRCWPADSEITSDNEPKNCKGLTQWAWRALTCESVPGS